MADIIQAGKWIDEGKFVRRSTWGGNSRIGPQKEFPRLVDLYWDDGAVHCSGAFVLSTSDLSTDDWELA